MPAQHQVKQLRRVGSFMARLRAHFAKPFCQRRFDDIVLEWTTIRKSRAFRQPFLHWICNHLPEVGHAVMPVPTLEWLHQVHQYVKHSVESTVRQDHATRLAKEQFRRMVDRKDGSNKAVFAMGRGSGKPMIRSVVTKVEEEGVVMPLTSTTYEVYLPRKTLTRCKPEFPLVVQDTPGKILAVEDHHRLFQPHTQHAELPSEAKCLQHQHVVNPLEVAEEP